MNAFALALERALMKARPEQAREVRLRMRQAGIFGPDLARRCRARLEGDRVVLELKDPRWVAQVQTLAAELLPRFQAVVFGVRSIEVRAVPWSKPIAREISREKVAVEQSPAGEAASRPPAVLSQRFEVAANALGESPLADRLREVAGRYLAARKAATEAASGKGSS